MPSMILQNADHMEFLHRELFMDQMDERDSVQETLGYINRDNDKMGGILALIKDNLAKISK